ncbi:ABC transporter substrate-binding protein [Actinoallomurus purpureus]|uniref:ABC transporter substrate-binding protein n=1 Tax=Actinoallomurus purpureus TaxID=478114 RepID=UPI0020935983|nr:ABC transporter substrate-binding protein [Actinoallomurus purpureus]MCO6006937.1 ABC transporter substrate-binding protein [Actinoallomurus purpureus]
MKTSKWFAASALLPLWLASACGGAGASSGKTADGLTKVKVAPDWIAADITWIPYTVGISNGFYKAAGLDVSLVPPPDNSSSVKIVASGQADIAETTLTDQVFAAKQSLPVISIANLSQTNNWGFFTKTGAKLASPAALKGMKVGVFDDAWTKAMLGVVLRKAGLKATDIQQVTATDSDIPLLIAGKIDVATNTTNFGPPSYAEKTGAQPETMPATGLGAPDIPIWNYAASTRWLQKNPDLARKWLAATAKATEWAIANPDAAVKAYEAYHKLKPSGYATDLAEWKATVPLLKGSTGLFTATDGQWTQLTQALVAAGQLDKALPPSTYYTNKYIG